MCMYTSDSFDQHIGIIEIDIEKILSNDCIQNRKNKEYQFSLECKKKNIIAHINIKEEATDFNSLLSEKSVKYYFFTMVNKIALVTNRTCVPFLNGEIENLSYGVEIKIFHIDQISYARKWLR